MNSTHIASCKAVLIKNSCSLAIALPITKINVQQKKLEHTVHFSVCTTLGARTRPFSHSWSIDTWQGR